MPATRNSALLVTSWPGSSQRKYSIASVSPTFARKLSAAHALSTIGSVPSAVSVRPGCTLCRSIAVTSEYGTSRSPTFIVLARYVNTGWARLPSDATARCTASAARSSSRPASDSTTSARPSSALRTRRPTSSTVAAWRTIDSSAAAAPGPPSSAVSSRSSSRCDTSTVFTRAPTSSSARRRSSGRNTARTSPCCAASENSPICDGSTTKAVVRRSVRPRSSFLPCIDSRGTSEGRCTRTRMAAPGVAPISLASAGLSAASRSPMATGGTAWNAQKRSSTP